MHRLIIVVAGLVTIAGLADWGFGQSNSSTNQSLDGRLAHLPTDLKLKEDQPQKYRISFDYIQLDTLGNPTGKERVTAEFVRALPEGKVRWNNVRIAKAKTFDQPFNEGEAQNYMEGFTYALSKREDMLKRNSSRDSRRWRSRPRTLFGICT